MDSGTDPLLLADVRLCGYLRKQKSRRRRYFVLRCGGERGPPRLEYYENEKKFRAGGLCSRPKKTLPLEGMLTINKRADARHQHLIVLCGREGTFGVAAESAEQQQAWYLAMVELHDKGEWGGCGESLGSLWKSQNCLLGETEGGGTRQSMPTGDEGPCGGASETAGPESGSVPASFCQGPF